MARATRGTHAWAFATDKSSNVYFKLTVTRDRSRRYFNSTRYASARDGQRMALLRDREPSIPFRFETLSHFDRSKIKDSFYDHARCTLKVNNSARFLLLSAARSYGDERKTRLATRKNSNFNTVIFERN